MPNRDELDSVAVAVRVLDAACCALDWALLRAYPMLDEDPFVDPHALDQDPRDAAAEVAFIVRSLRYALSRYRRLTRRPRAATQHARTAATHRAR